MTPDKKLELEIQELRKTVDRIEEALTGNEFTKAKGIIGRLIAVEEFIESFNKKKLFYVGWISAAVFIIGMIVAIVKMGAAIIAFFK
jgi:hypothetical protein